jgi:hypothetical protein
VANQIYTRLQRVYAAIEATFGIAPAGAPSNTDCCLITTFSGDAKNPEIVRPDKTGAFGEILGIMGRRSATWSATLSAAANGVRGIKADCDVFLQLLFGQPTVAVASTSVTCTMSEQACPTATVFDYNNPGTATQFVVLGCLCSKFSTSFGGDVPMLTFSGECMWVYDTIQAADSNTDTIAPGGLASIPVQPSAPVTNGAPPQGFSGLISLDSNTFTTLRTGSIDVTLARELEKDGFSVYPIAPGAGLYSVSFSCELYDDDSTILNTLKTAATDPLGPVIPMSFQIGTVPGNIWTYNLKNCRVTCPTYDKQQARRTVKFTGKAHDTTIGSADAFVLVIT